METEIDVSKLRNVKLIVSDLDRTLLTSKRELPPNFNDYIARLDECGIVFAVASGRPCYTLKIIFNQTKNKVAFIGDNGGLVFYKDEILDKNLLPPEKYQPMVITAQEETKGVPLVSGIDCAFISKKDRVHEKFLRISCPNITFVDELSSVYEQADKFSVYFPNFDSKVFFEKVFKPKYGADFSVTVGDDVWVDIMNAGVNKGSAIKVLSHHIGVSYDEIMAFGDAPNDIEMLEAAKYSYVVKNADASMRKYARFMADSNDDFGVSKVLDMVLKSHGK
jgi:Cof subfamily protein (haloacid dehalogenase superfamily)